MGRGRVGKRYQLKNKQQEEPEVRIRCKETGCNECWNSMEEAANSGGCSWHGCKIAAEHMTRQQRCALLAEEAITKAKGSTIKVFTKSHPVHRDYKAKDDEIVLEKEWPPLESFRLMK